MVRVVGLVWRDSRLQFVTDVDELPLVQSVAALILDALPVVRETDACNAHALRTDLVVPRASKMLHSGAVIVLVTEAASCKDEPGRS